MDRTELEHHTKAFQIRIIKLCNRLPKMSAGFETGKQFIRSAGSVGANYRATRRAKSTNGFINKLRIIIEEADKPLYWLQIIKEIPLLSDIEKIENLVGEPTN